MKKYDKYISDCRILLGLNYLMLEDIYDVFEEDGDIDIGNFDKEYLLLTLKNVSGRLQRIRDNNLNALNAINWKSYVRPSFDEKI